MLVPLSAVPYRNTPRERPEGRQISAVSFLHNGESPLKSTSRCGKLCQELSNVVSLGYFFLPATVDRIVCEIRSPPGVFSRDIARYLCTARPSGSDQL